MGRRLAVVKELFSVHHKKVEIFPWQRGGSGYGRAMEDALVEAFEPRASRARLLLGRATWSLVVLLWVPPFISWVLPGLGTVSVGASLLGLVLMCAVTTGTVALARCSTSSWCFRLFSRFWVARRFESLPAQVVVTCPDQRVRVLLERRLAGLEPDALEVFEVLSVESESSPLGEVLAVSRAV